MYNRLFRDAVRVTVHGQTIWGCSNVKTIWDRLFRDVARVIIHGPDYLGK